MITRSDRAFESLLGSFPQYAASLSRSKGSLVLEVPPEDWEAVALKLRDAHQFEQLMDLCAVDYLHYGVSEWATQSSTHLGFDRARVGLEDQSPVSTPGRFGVVVHLLSISANVRLRLKTRLDVSSLRLASLTAVWPSALWFEREAFDLFGVWFEHHPDLRRLLTDYAFCGHPFRKDFPQIGEWEARYDATEQRVVYEPCSIAPRVLVPKVIRTEDPSHA